MTLLEKKFRKTKNTSKQVFMKKPKSAQWAKHGKCVGELRQKCIQNFTPKLQKKYHLEKPVVNVKTISIFVHIIG